MQANTNNAAVRSARRGNTIVLVTAILVLLVILATAFVSRTRAVRATSAAQQGAAGRDGRAESVGVNVAGEIAGALFAKPVSVNPNGSPVDPFARLDNSVTPAVVVASSSWPRDAAPLDASRYSIDRDAGNGLPLFGYNFAPYEVKAWTNWPDQFGGASNWPFGAGAPNGTLVDATGGTIADANPYGGPGMSDTRWLRSTEPQRVGVDQDGDGYPDLFTFSHWPHLSWLPSANNGWRVVVDISDITLTTVDNLNENDPSRSFATAIPYEQWLPNITPAGFTSLAQITAGPGVAGSFLNRRNTWFGPFNAPQNYSTAYKDPSVALPNFFRLKDLGKPTDEFKGGTARNIISRTFTDTDGDGFTDSFWFLAPVGTDRSIRTLVGISVVDNSALLNANLATKFSFDTTAGHTPADNALVTSAAEYTPISQNGTTVGFFDGPINQPSSQITGGGLLPNWSTGNPNIIFSTGTPRYDRGTFGDALPYTQPSSFLQSIGMRTPNGLIESGFPTLGLSLNDTTLATQDPPLPPATFESASERLAYFKLAGSDPEHPNSGLTPFDTSDEFELRAYHGNNFPGVLSRFEQAVNLFSPAINGDNANSYQFLRSTPQREEADEYLDQLDARQLLVDNRRKLTMFSGARNEMAPPGIWPSAYYDETFNYLSPGANVPAPTDTTYNAFQAANRNEYSRQKYKIDLREPNFVDANGQPALNRNAFAAFQWRRDLQRLLERTLTQTYQDSTGATKYVSYLGTRDRDFNRTRSMIASYVANLDCASDEPQTIGTTGIAIDRPLYPSAPQTDPQGYFPPTTDVVQDPIRQDQFYTGMEKQPFIMEVFMGLVYPKSEFKESEWQGQDPPAGQEELPPDVDDGGENYVDSSSKPSLIVAVQIANPYDTPISLGDFRLQCFGQTFNFTVGSIAAGYGPNPTLAPATLGKPTTAIVYAVANGVVGGYATGAFRAAVLDFFDIEKGEMQGTTLQQNDNDGDGAIEYATLYDSKGNLTVPPTSPDFADPLDRTMVFDATGQWNVNLNAPGEPNSTNAPYTSLTQQPVQILRNLTPPVGVSGGPISVVVDRFDNEDTGPKVKFTEAFNRLFTDPQFIPPEKKYYYEAQNSPRNYVAGVRIKDNDFLMTWCRASRIWGWDVSSWDDPTVPIASRKILATERSPRYVFSMATEPVRSERQQPMVSTIGSRLDGALGFKGDVWKIGQDPDGDASGQNRWANYTFVDMFGRQMRGKPTFFTNLIVTTTGGTEQIASAGGNTPMPFLPKLGLTAGTGNIYEQDCHGITNFNGQAYEWMIGNKGARLTDWQRFKQVPVTQIPFQMTQKDSDFEQVGEVLDVFLWGHVYRGWGSNPTCVRTFSETMLDDDVDSEFFPGTGLYVNRLQLRLPGEQGTNDLGTPVINSRFDVASTTNPPAPSGGYNAWIPALPTGVAFLDGLTIDGAGRNSFDRDSDGDFNEAIDLAHAEERRFGLGGRYANRATPGLININTAMPEVMQAMPMMTRLSRAGTVTPYTRLTDAIRSYRDRGILGTPTPAFATPFYFPTYEDRGLTPSQITSSGLGSTLPTDMPRFFPTMRGERGFASIGELMLLARTPPAGTQQGARNSYSVRYLGLDPYDDLITGDFGEYPVGYSWSTDLTNSRPRQLPSDIYYAITPPPVTAIPTKPIDEALGDVEDMNLLFKGISNLVTTRSDVFTVYLRVRQVKQNDTTGVWDGTNRDQVVDDTRYVMCVDRSNVNSPDDQPKILYFQKCP